MALQIDSATGTVYLSIALLIALLCAIGAYLLYVEPV
jgi:hypothetical protein